MSGSAQPRFHWLRFRTTRHGTEDPDKVRRALAVVTRLETDRFEEHLAVTPMASHHGTAMELLEVEVTRSRIIRDCLAHLLEGLDAGALRDELDRRLDDDRVLYVRFDKQRALAGELAPTTGEDAVQVRVKIDAHPGTREAALDAWRRFLYAADPVQ